MGFPDSVVLERFCGGSTLRLIRKEPRLVVVDYLWDSDPISRRLQPGEMATSSLNGAVYRVISDTRNSESIYMRHLTVEKVGECVPGVEWSGSKWTTLEVQRDQLVPFVAVEASGKQEVKELGHTLGIAYCPKAFLHTFTCNEQRSNPCVLTPVPSSKYATNGRRYWVFQDAVYSSIADLKPDEVKALITEEEDRINAKVSRSLERAQRKGKDEGIGRQPIPDDVKMFVWQRDGGRCVKCGSNQCLEFDHIIPVVMGGANTSRNLQLLCEPCNRSKGGNLV